MGIKEIQIQALTDVKDQGKLSDQQMKWLMAEHLKNQKNLESMYDDEISRQRMVLEEKLAKRKALAQAAVSCDWMVVIGWLLLDVCYLMVVI